MSETSECDIEGIDISKLGTHEDQLKLNDLRQRRTNLRRTLTKMIQALKFGLQMHECVPKHKYKVAKKTALLLAATDKEIKALKNNNSTLRDEIDSSSSFVCDRYMDSWWQFEALYVFKTLFNPTEIEALKACNMETLIVFEDDSDDDH